MYYFCKINHPSWEREQAIEYMLRNSAESREGVEREIDRYITWPGQATAYTVGEIKIKQLRQKAEIALGKIHLCLKITF